MKMLLLTILHFLTITYWIPLPGQKNPAPNLVPNPSFEEYSDEPSGWYYSGKDFARVAMFWTSPTAASPDIYGPKVRVPASWEAAGFGDTKPYHGSSYAGITVYGCDKGKPHCREYIQVLLAEPLIPGQQYGFSCMVAHLPKSVSVKNIGLAFSEHEIDEGAHEPLFFQTALTLDRLIPSDGKWNRWTGTFEADKTMSYLLIGNFKSDDDSQVKIPLHSDLRFGYYYLDDIRLYKIPPLINPPASDSPLKNYIPKAGESVVLSSIYFEHDRTDFMPRALIQLNELLAFLKKYPTLHIEIIGHTDNVGTTEYNQQLSVKRAGAVAWFLKKRGIDAKRLTSSGVGATQPVGSNFTSIGKSQNRRVEIKVIRL
jgi:outer membrane protein OmpA-like peptidoglycan-associated protein